jgi:hypothetical protein
MTEQTNIAVEFDRDAYVDLTKAMKSADTTADNKATPWARATLSALLSTPAFTLAVMDSTLIAAYKPKTASGKVANSRGALPHSPRQRANTVAYCFTNKDVGEVRTIVDAFVTDAAGAPRSIAALHTAVKAAVKAAGEALASEVEPDEGEAVEPVAVEPVAVDLASDMLRLAGLIESLSDPTPADVDAMALLMGALVDATARATAPVDMAMAA